MPLRSGMDIVTEKGEPTMTDKETRNRRKLKLIAYNQRVEAWLAKKPPRILLWKWLAWRKARPKWEG